MVGDYGKTPLDCSQAISYDISHVRAGVRTYATTKGAAMCNPRDDWGFGPGFPFGAKWWAGASRGRGPRRRSQMFESGEVKFVILRLLKEKPRHGYEVIKALEEKMG